MSIDYEEVFAACGDKAVRGALSDALARLFEHDGKLLELNASEQAIAARIAAYLGPHFDGHHVDVEYNRMGNVPKEVAWHEKPERVFPDIIVHIRDTPTNILAVELKKSSNAESKHDDILKLRAYIRELGYVHALFIRLGVGKLSRTITECEWVKAD